MKLKDNREYWNELKKNNNNFEHKRIVDKYSQQMQFTGQEPKLEMFVNLLEKPKLIYEPTPDDMRSHEQLELQYQQAEDKILFKGFEYIDIYENGNVVDFTLNDTDTISFNNGKWDYNGHEFKTLESFVGCELTENGQKLVGYEN